MESPDFALFSGIKPLWEHSKNKDGGKFIIKLKKGVISRLWENLLFAVLGKIGSIFVKRLSTNQIPGQICFTNPAFSLTSGEQFLVGDEINGVVLSIRHWFDSISLWNLNAKNKMVISHIRETLRRVLNLNESYAIDYKPFNQRPNPN